MRIIISKMALNMKAMLERTPDYKEVVEKNGNDCFQGARNLHSIWSNLGRMDTSLKQWSKNTFGSVKKDQELEQSLAIIRFSNSTPAYSSDKRLNEIMSPVCMCRNHGSSTF